MTDLQGKVALVTGASGGIGGACAEMLANAGATVLLAGRNLPQLEERAARFSRGETRAQALAFELGDPQAVKEAFGALAKLTGRLDILVNSAGIMCDAALAMTRLDQLDAQYRINVAGTFLCCQYASRLMARHGGGSIVNMASIVGERGAPGQSAYAASKAAIDGLTRSLSKELAPLGIRVNAVAPGFIETEMTRGYDESKREAIQKGIALGRSGTPADVAGVVLFLASDLARYVTGQVIGADGGMTL